MKIPIYQVDAFTDKLFAGNPAAVCPLDQWLDDCVLQSIAAENNLAETAFFVRMGDRHHLRWFTPAVEVDLCGHATLASAYVIFERLAPHLQCVAFDTRSGELLVRRAGDRLEMDFPSLKPEPVPMIHLLAEGLGKTPRELYSARDYLAVFDTQDEVLELDPDMEKIRGLDRFAVIATAPGRDCDFVSRFFAPQQGVPEDPVTGSAHCMLAPYWGERLGKRELHARQVSKRGGDVFCGLAGDRVKLGGHAVMYLEGSISV
jgi:predicted PhzF superfamily epimerase YddE/YHI9